MELYNKIFSTKQGVVVYNLFYLFVLRLFFVAVLVPPRLLRISVRWDRKSVV